MGLFDKIFRPREDKEAQKALHQAEGTFRALTVYRPVFTSWRGAIYESELVRAAIDAKARHISKLQIQIEGAAKPGLSARLRQGPNQWQTWSQFFYRTSTILDVTNTCFIVPVLDDQLSTTGFFPVLPERCEVVQYKGEPWLRYRFGQDQVAAVEMRRCAVLTRHQYRSDFFGETNDALDDTMKLIHMEHQGIEEAVRNSATYRFMAQLNNFANEEDLANERKRFSEKNFSADAGSGLLLFPNTYTNIQQLKESSYSVDADQLKLIQNNVYDYFGVNAGVIQNTANADALDAFFNGAIEPFAIQFSEAITKAAYTERERSIGAAIYANSNRLQYMTTTSKVQMAQQLLDRGVMTVNEARDLFNLTPVPGGDVRTIRGEYKSADELDQADEGGESNDNSEE
jgi:hypothetical protein